MSRPRSLMAASAPVWDRNSAVGRIVVRKDPPLALFFVRLLREGRLRRAPPGVAETHQAGDAAEGVVESGGIPADGDSSVKGAGAPGVQKVSGRSSLEFAVRCVKEHVP
jgi:hypothetical protein